MIFAYTASGSLIFLIAILAVSIFDWKIVFFKFMSDTKRANSPNNYAFTMAPRLIAAHIKITSIFVRGPISFPVNIRTE